VPGRTPRITPPVSSSASTLASRRLTPTATPSKPPCAGRYPPNIWGNLTAERSNRILDCINAGLPGKPEGRRYSGATQATKRGAWAAVQEFCPALSRERAQKVIVAWLDTGVLINEPYDDPPETKPQWGVVVGKRPGVLRREVWFETSQTRGRSLAHGSRSTTSGQKARNPLILGTSPEAFVLPVRSTNRGSPPFGRVYRAATLRRGGQGEISLASRSPYKIPAKADLSTAIRRPVENQV
jgi:hypothetical protein